MGPIARGTYREIFIFQIRNKKREMEKSERDSIREKKKGEGKKKETKKNGREEEEGRKEEK